MNSMGAAAPTTPLALTTPIKPPPTVDISSIEAAKENIQPLVSGRSASHLVALGTQTRSGLGNKLASEHSKFQSQIDAVAEFERNGGQWTEGYLGFTVEEITNLAEDPLDLHHQYARFVLGNYPAGASAANKLIPLLEQSTRTFLNDERYRNDPRYLRLWNLYAKNIDCPEDCYRFLFAKGIGERLALLYEEYANVLEQAGRRTKADQIYILGINRSAAPLERLKKRHADFTARMLVAPPVYSPNTSTSPSSTPRISSQPILRPILSGAGVGPQSSAASSAKENNPNGASLFAIFRDDASSAGETAAGAEWKDLGTVKSRKRENEIEAKEWKGETMPMTAASASKSGAFKLEVFRDSDAPTPITPHTDSTGDVFSRSLRGPSEAEMLRKNPFKNYSETDANLLEKDPLAGLPLLPPPKSDAASSTTPSTDKSTSSAGLKVKSKKSEAKVPAPKPTSDRVACDLTKIYPNPGQEFSFEEIAIKTRRLETGNDCGFIGWEWNSEWQTERKLKNFTDWEIDLETGFPRLHDKITSENLYDFLPLPPKSESPVAVSPTVNLIDGDEKSPIRSASPQSQILVSPSPIAAQSDSPTPSSSSSCRSSSASPAPLRRRPSPTMTMNTRDALDLVNGFFAQTIDFGKMQHKPAETIDEAQKTDNESETSSAESEEDEDEENSEAHWARVPVSQLEGIQSQFTQTSQQTQSQDSEQGFIPFSQTTSQAQESDYNRSEFATQLNELSVVHEQTETSENSAQSRNSPHGIMLNSGIAQDENIIAKPQPMQLFRDAPNAIPGTPASSAFRPTRKPFGLKPPSLAPLASTSTLPTATGFGDSIFGGDDIIASSQNDVIEEGESFDEVDHVTDSAAILNEEPETNFTGAGANLGRRPPGLNRYAEFIDHMTPIIERTREYTQSSEGGCTTSSLSTSQRSRRDSVFTTIQTPVMEEEEEDDEDSTSGETSTEDEEDDDDVIDGLGDRAFVEFQQSQNSQPEEFSDQTSTESESEPETEDEEEQEEAQVSNLISLHVPLVDLQPIVEAGSPSFENSLPEGFTITGNQTDMNSNLVLVDTTNLPTTLPDEEIAPVQSSVVSNVSIDPFCRETIQTQLARLNPSVLQHFNLRNLTSIQANNMSQLNKTAKKRELKAKSKDRSSIVPETWQLELNGEIFTVETKLGEGSFGAVFRVTQEGEQDAAFEVDNETSVYAVKVEQPTNLWEFHVLNQLHARLDERSRESVVTAQKLYAFKDESYLFLEHCSQGSLLDAVNKANEIGIAPPTAGASQGLEEVVAMFFVVELLRVIEGFHSAGFLHGDLKIDNCLVRLHENVTCEWSTQYNSDGSLGWAEKGIKLIDFGRTIDLNAYPATQEFITSAVVDEFDCIEMRQNRSWVYQPDYFGLASIAFNVLFGRYIETKISKDENDREIVSINQNFKRYHQISLWEQLFFILLNPVVASGDSRGQATSQLRKVRQEMEFWLEQNSEKNGKSLRKMLKQMMLASPSA